MLKITNIEYVGAESVLRKKYERYKNFIETHPKSECPPGCLKGYERREAFVKEYSKLFK